jgi:hypothetical protein
MVATYKNKNKNNKITFVVKLSAIEDFIIIKHLRNLDNFMGLKKTSKVPLVSFVKGCLKQCISASNRITGKLRIIFN